MIVFLKELYRFFKNKKKYWLLPFFLALGLLGILIAFSNHAIVSQFVYPLF